VIQFEMKNENIIITGGAGFLGREIIKRTYEENQITVFSRDEAKHYFLKKQYPRVRFIVGDIRDFDRLSRACEGQTVGVFAASLKQIEACDENAEEASKTIITGAFNSRKAAEDRGFKAACFISSDKSRAATTVYGAMKYVAGESFILHANGSPRLTTAIYGNVLNSTGSVIPLLWNAIKSGRELQLYSDEMTRFLLSVDDAVSIIVKSVTSDLTGVNVVPKIPSARIKDIFDLFKAEFGLRYVMASPRVGEKIHEVMASSEEIRRMKFNESLGLYTIDPHREFNELSFENNEYSSRDCCLTPQELYETLASHSFFKPGE